jgi:hypothetical protein
LRVKEFSFERDRDAVETEFAQSLFDAFLDGWPSDAAALQKAAAN